MILGWVRLTRKRDAIADEQQKLEMLLLDPRWLTAKLEATGNSAALIADYNRYAAGEPQKVIGRALRVTAGICARDRRQLLPQLLGRLMANQAVVASGFLNAARQCLLPPAILEQNLSLIPPGAETARFEGHSKSGPRAVRAARRTPRVGLQ
jgi:hypothetical protein